MKLTTHDVTEIVHNTATSGGTVTDYGGRTVKECGICWSTEDTPTTGDNVVKGSISKDKWSCRIEGLTKETKYYVRAYVIASDNTVFYGESKLFTTTHEVMLPTLSQVSASAIQTTAMTLQCQVTDNGNSDITACGFCWSTNMDPTTDNDKVTCDLSVNTFGTNVSGLQDGTKYYVRAYATNALGTSYSETLEVTTATVTIPVWGTISASAIGKTKATIAGTLTSNGNADITEMGVCWGTNAFPTIYDSKQSCAVGSNLSIQLTGLQGSTSYYVRAYAQNSKGISYSNEVTFTTVDSEVDVWDGSVATEFAGGAGTESDPIRIETAAQLKLLANKVNSGTEYVGVYFKLMSNIDLGNKGWEPIGKDELFYEFCGDFDGNNLSIIGLRVVTQGTSYYGLFGYISSASITNLKVSSTTSYKSGGNFGIICGYAKWSDLIRLETSGSVVATGFGVGAICGRAERSSIVNCTNLANMKATGEYNVGGICGYATDTEISNCVNRGNIEGATVGGIIANMGFDVELSNCCNYSNVVGLESQAGGIVGDGLDRWSSAKNCFWLYEVEGNVGIEKGSNGDRELDTTYNGHFVRSNGSCQLEDGSDLVETLNLWIDDYDPSASIYRRWEYKVGSDGYAYPVLK
jgi:hypothetical protein